MAWPIKTCGRCKQAPDDRGFCGCEPPFSLDAMPAEKADGIARVMYPHIVSFYKAFYEVPGNREFFQAWQREYHSRKTAGIKPALPPRGWKP